jgi:hypothetical protein
MPSILQTYIERMDEHPYAIHTSCIGPKGNSLGKLVEIVVKGAKVDGCKPSFQARLR